MKTIILLRHADINPPPGPASDTLPLNALGQARASTLAHVLGNAGVTAVFTSPARRTQQTAEPLAAKLGLQIQVPSGPAQTIQNALSDLAGPVVLIVGHSNTVPQLITGFGVPFSATLIHGHDDLFILTVVEQSKASLVHLKYGAPTP